jgi:hypothetical protein
MVGFVWSGAQVHDNEMTLNPQAGICPSQTPEISAYLERRNRFHADVGQTWPGTLNEPTDILDPIAITNDDVVRIRTAARCILGLYDAVSTTLRQLPEESLTKIGIPLPVASIAKAPSPVDDLLLARLDLIYTTTEIKLLDANFDAPGLAVETFEINKLVCRKWKQRDPNNRGRVALLELLHRTMKTAAQFINVSPHHCRIAVCYRRGYSREWPVHERPVLLNVVYKTRT